MKFNQTEADRGNFEVNEKGFYSRQPDGKYLKVSEAKIKPSLGVKMLLVKGYTNKEIKAITGAYFERLLKQK